MISNQSDSRTRARHHPSRRRGRNRCSDGGAALILIATALACGPAVNRVLVQQLVRKGKEMMIGTRNDRSFENLVLCGFGGIDMELSHDMTVVLAPVTRDQTLKLILSLKRGAVAVRVPEAPTPSKLRFSPMP